MTTEVDQANSDVGKSGSLSSSNKADLGGDGTTAIPVPQHMMSDAECRIVRLLLTGGPIHGTAQVGLKLWPERRMTPQGAAFAVGGILRRLVAKRYVKTKKEKGVTVYSCTTLGDYAQELNRLDTIDHRQLSLLDD